MHHKTLDAIFGICIVLVILWFIWEAAPWSFHSRLFPWTIGLSVLVLALVQVGASLRNLGRRQAINGDGSGESCQDSPAIEVNKSSVAWRVVSICSWIALFFAGIWLLGFRLGSLILTVSFMKFAGREEYKICFALGLINYLFFLVVFDLALRVPLFEGALAQWLGIEALDKFIVRNLVSVWS